MPEYLMHIPFEFFVLFSAVYVHSQDGMPAALTAIFQCFSVCLFPI